MNNYWQSARADILIWLLLVIATLSSWWLGHVPEQLDVKLITPLIILVSLIKVRLVVLHFMEIKSAIWPLRLMFEAWCWLVPGILVLLLSAS